jgi:ParB-like chromosome segregation protein Spo0J
MRAGQACLQGSTLALWEIQLLVRSYKNDVAAVARHLEWPEVKVQAAVNYAAAFPEEINEAMAENETTDFEALKRMLPQATEFVSKKAAKTEMLKLLLDEHISPDVAKGLCRRNRAWKLRYMVEWEMGHFLGQEDSPCLREAGPGINAGYL